MMMELTEYQQKSISDLGLEAVGRAFRAGDWWVDRYGNVGMANSSGLLEEGVVVRPAHAAKVAELEAENEAANESAETNYHRRKNAEHKLRAADEHNGRLLLKIESLESELAPIRALKVGSAEWACYQMAIGRPVISKSEVTWTAKAWADCEPFTPYTPPEPEPTAAELAEVVLAWAKSWSQDRQDKLDAMIALASRVKQTKVCPKCDGDGKANGGIGGDNRCLTCMGRGDVIAKEAGNGR